jgi:hypothetical protein
MVITRQLSLHNDEHASAVSQGVGIAVEGVCAIVGRMHGSALPPRQQSSIVSSLSGCLESYRFLSPLLDAFLQRRMIAIIGLL